MPDDILLMDFDPSTIEHLGLHQYSSLPPVIAELVANSYDADANEVQINLIENGEKEIAIVDNGHGMSFDDINKKFLRIGRNRRTDEDSDKTESGERKAIGKKGIGKLSFFGITERILVTTIRNKLRNIFIMDLNALAVAGKKGEKYKPEIVERNVNIDEPDGTTIKLLSIKRKSKFDPEGLAKSLSRYFDVFDEEDFKVTIRLNDNDPIDITNDLKYENIESLIEWKLPEDVPFQFDYEKQDKVKGRLVSAKEVVLDKYQGVALYSRGKLVNVHEFYDVNTSSHGYSYIVGWLDVSFIDDYDKELISTNRKSLNWEVEEAADLREYLTFTVYQFYNAQRQYRETLKVKAVEEIIGENLYNFIDEMPNKHDAKLAKKIVDIIIKSEGIDVEKSGQLINYTRDSFQFESFKEIASEITEMEHIDGSLLTKILHEWELIEAREFYKISLVRVKAITTFERFIAENALEVPTLHNFFKTFPWLLDPRIREFQDEVYYSQILKEKYDDSKELEQDRRIDFLCTSVADTRFVIELKRPNHRLSKKDVEQAQDYRIFVEEHAGTDGASGKNVIAYVIVGDRNKGNKLLEENVEMFRKEGKIIVKTFGELLTQAQRYHQEFIDNYQKLKLDKEPDDKAEVS